MPTSCYKFSRKRLDDFRIADDQPETLYTISREARRELHFGAIDGLTVHFFRRLRFF
jgi:hypothetical protein